MIKQLIFVTESDIDWLYINSTIRAIYDVQNIRLDYVSMNGKNNYNKKTVISKVDKIKRGINGESVVIYCYDTDDIDTNPNDLRFDKEITEYCDKNGYGLVWFCRDIEEVFTGSRVTKEIKRKTAENYVRKIKEKPYSRIDIYSNDKNKNKSNIMLTIDSYLKKRY